MNKKLTLFLGFSLGLGIVVQAQNLGDITRNSGTIYQGTARSTGAGNAFGAVGSDYGALDINPAGLGLYRQNEFTFTLGYSQATANSSYLGNSAVDHNYNLNIGNLGLVFAKPRIKDGKEVENGWVSVNWAIGFNRTNNFNTTTTISGTNTGSSILNAFRDDANYQAAYLGVHGSSQLLYGSLGLLGYETYLVNPYQASNGDTIYDDATRFDNKIKAGQTAVIQTSGSTQMINISVAGNYSNKFYIGGSLGFPVLNYANTTTFTENNLNPMMAANDSQYQKAVLTNRFTTSGIGITANIGAIYRITDMFRIGLSAELPTVYSLSDADSKITLSSIVGNKVYNWSGDDGGVPFSYNMITPAKLTASAAVFFGKHGFISADYQYVDYTMAKVYNQDSDFTALNQFVRNSMTGVNSIRIGGEFVMDQFAVRAGYNYISSPYKSNLANAGYADASNIYSAGIGFRENNLSLDLTWQYIINKSTYTPYYLDEGSAPSANITTARSNVLLTMALRFNGESNEGGNRRHRYYR